MDTKSNHQETKKNTLGKSVVSTALNHNINDQKSSCARCVGRPPSCPSMSPDWSVTLQPESPAAGSGMRRANEGAEAVDKETMGVVEQRGGRTGRGDEEGVDGRCR